MERSAGQRVKNFIKQFSEEILSFWLTRRTESQAGQKLALLFDRTHEICVADFLMRVFSGTRLDAEHKSQTANGHVPPEEWRPPQQLADASRKTVRILGVYQLLQSMWQWLAYRRLDNRWCLAPVGSPCVCKNGHMNWPEQNWTDLPFARVPDRLP